MPIYDWQCSRCKTEVSLIKKIGNENTKPEGDEIPEESGEEPCAHEWNRVIKHVHATRAPSWGSKGNW